MKFDAQEIGIIIDALYKYQCNPDILNDEEIKNRALHKALAMQDILDFHKKAA